MKILQDKPIIDFLEKENNQKIKATISKQQLEIHIDFKCGCKITQDNKGNSLFPCDKHLNYFNTLRNNIILHKILH